MRKPTIHLNGTSRQSLIKDYEEAAQAVYKAREALHVAGPNARDYYVQGPEAWAEAAEDHRKRDEKLRQVYDELCVLVEHCHEGT